MRINQEPPDLKTILKKTLNKKNFKSKYVNEEEKNYFLQNFDTIDFYDGNMSEIAIIKKNLVS